MKFSVIVAGLVAVAAAAPVNKRAVFTTKTYNELSISGGKAGNGEAEALAKLAGLPDDLTEVEEADLDFLNSVNQIANDAETEAFNVAIEAAEGAELDALKVGLSAMCIGESGGANSLLLARQDEEQDPQARGHGAQARSAGGAGTGRCSQACRGAEEAGDQHQGGQGGGGQDVKGAGL